MNLMYLTKIRRFLAYRWAFGCVLLVTLLVAGCVYLDEVIQPDSVKAGEVLEVTLRAHADAGDNRDRVHFVIGMLVPRVWNAADHMTMTYVAEEFGSGTLVQIPEGVKAPNYDGNMDWAAALYSKFGIGPNLIDDMEWVVFWTKETYNVAQGEHPTIEAQISLETGPQNVKFKVGYFVGTSEDGLNDFGAPETYYKTWFSDCFETTDGEGDVIDFCNPPQTFLDPYRSTDNDILTLTYDRDVIPGPLSDEIYLCATAELVDGGTKTVCETTEVQRMIAVEGAAGRFEITLWPRQYFGLQEGEVIERLTYHFTDQSGSIKVGYANTEEPFVYTFKCD